MTDTLCYFTTFVLSLRPVAAGSKALPGTARPDSRTAWSRYCPGRQGGV